MSDTIDPKDATRIRVFYENPHWTIDAADDSGQYTDEVWTHWNNQPMSREVAISRIGDFAVTVGRPDLASIAEIEDDNAE